MGFRASELGSFSSQESLILDHNLWWDSTWYTWWNMKITENLFTVSNADVARRVARDEDYLSQQINCKEQLNLKAP